MSVVFVVGLPQSGNRLLAERIEAHGGEAVLCHGHMPGELTALCEKYSDVPISAVIPVRPYGDIKALGLTDRDERWSTFSKAAAGKLYKQVVYELALNSLHVNVLDYLDVVNTTDWVEAKIHALVHRQERPKDLRPKSTVDKYVFLCGLPKSGNTLLKDLLASAGVAGSYAHGIKEGQVSRQLTYLRERDPMRSVDARVLIPARRWDMWSNAVYDANYKTEHTNLEYAYRCYNETFQEVAKTQLETLFVCYENIVAQPDIERRRVLELFNLDPDIEWHTDIVDGNVKYQENPRIAL